MSFATLSFRATDAEEYEHFMARWSRRLAGPFLDFVGVKAGDRVLDVGCGTGVISVALAERGCTVVGMDASEPYLEGARRNRPHSNIVYDLGDARRMSYAMPPSVPVSRPLRSMSSRRSIRSSERCGA